MRRATGAATLASALILALGGCGEEESGGQVTATAPSEAIELTVLYDDGDGRKTTGTLTCRGSDRRAEGALDGRRSAAALCAQASGLKKLLTTPPDKGRTCTQVFGGPETAQVTGSIDGAKVDRRFTRTNGCEITDFTRASGLLRQ